MLTELSGAAVPVAETQKRVLVLYSTRRDAQIAIVGELTLPRILDGGLAQGVDYYSEYLDRARFPDPQYQLGFRDFLAVKYRGLRFDLVIGVQDIALDFIAQHQPELFPDTPVVFSATSSTPRRPVNSTGVIAPLDFKGSLDLAAELQPDTRHVYVVSGADAADKHYESLARAQFRPLESRFTISYLAGLPRSELEARLAALPPKSIVYYLIVNRDGGGENVHPLDYLDRLSAIANAPVYCWVDSAMDHGIVGGSLKNQKAQTEALGQLAVRVLRGERPDGIPVSSPDLSVRQIDWRQAQRWGISATRVPAGTSVLFREPSGWDRYRGYILAAVAILVAQTALIAGLLVQGTKRRQAEEQLRRNQEELRGSYDRIRALGARLLEAQEAERSRIARELHDDISQQLVLLAIDLEPLGNIGDAGSRKQAVEAAARVQDLVKSVHGLSHRLHPAKLRHVGIVAALQGLQREMTQPALAVAFTHDNVPRTVPPDLTVCLFRIVQEALQNALKYSGARTVAVHLRGGPNVLALTIADDGVGFDVDAAWGKGLGLISMSERLEAIGGTLQIHSSPGAGTRLEVAVSLAGGRPAQSVPA